MSISETPTILALDEYARIMGLNPLAFSGATDPNNNIFGLNTDQQTMWYQYDYQAGKQMSRESLSNLIDLAERDIADYLGFWPGPKFFSQEIHKYPANKTVGDNIIRADANGRYRGIQSDYGHIVGVGRRKVTLDSTPTFASGEIAYSSPDGDAFNELATITIATTLTDEKEVKLYFEGQGGHPDYEIRPFKSIVISGGILTITLDSWLLLDYTLQNRAPGGEPITIDATDTDNYAASVDVYREELDATQASVRFINESEKTALGITFQDGYLQTRNHETGDFGAVPATYADDVWSVAAFDKSVPPQEVQLWYKAGYQSERYLNGNDIYPTDRFMNRLIAILATSRMEQTYRANNNVMNIVDEYRRDTLESFQDGSQFFVPPLSQNSPFGTRVGELQVWRSLKKFTKPRLMGYAQI